MLPPLFGWQALTYLRLTGLKLGLLLNFSEALIKKRHRTDREPFGARRGAVAWMKMHQFSRQVAKAQRRDNDVRNVPALRILASLRENAPPLFGWQVLTYLRLIGLKLGLLLNFSEALMKDGIERIVNHLEEPGAAPSHG